MQNALSYNAQSAAPERKPHLVIRPARGWTALNFREVWQFRDLLLMLALRDVKLRYRQTALGPVWVLLEPLLAAGVFSFIFTRLAALPTDGVPSFLFMYTGLLGFNVFAQTVSKTSGSLVGNQQLVSKVYFPRMVLPFSVVFSVLIDFAVALAVSVGLMVYFRTPVSPTILLLPVWLSLMVLLALGVGLVAAALTVTYRDVASGVRALLPFLQYISPVVYPVSLVAAKLGPLLPLYYLNPMAVLVQGFRWSLVGGTMPPPGFMLYAAVYAAGVFLAGAFLFSRKEQTFADVI